MAVDLLINAVSFTPPTIIFLALVSQVHHLRRCGSVDNWGEWMPPGGPNIGAHSIHDEVCPLEEIRVNPWVLSTNGGAAS